MRADLVDPQTHHVVLVRQAALGQHCSMCPQTTLRPNGILPGDFICNTAGDDRGWTCLAHLQIRLMVLNKKETVVPEETNKPSVHHVVMYADGQHHATNLTNACEAAEAEGLALMAVVEAGGGYVVAVFVEPADPGETQ